MKKILIIFTIIFATIINPITMKAEIKVDNLEEALKSEGITSLCENYKETDDQVIVYFFRKGGEDKTIQFLNYLNSICNEYGKYFKLRSYEVLNNEDNYELMYNVKDFMNSDVTDAPFIIIGDTHFVSYSEEVNGNILTNILSAKDNKVKTDVVSEVLVRYYRNENLMIGVTLVVVFGFIALMIYASIKGKKTD